MKAVIRITRRSPDKASVFCPSVCNQGCDAWWCPVYGATRLGAGIDCASIRAKNNAPATVGVAGVGKGQIMATRPSQMLMRLPASLAMVCVLAASLLVSVPVPAAFGAPVGVQMPFPCGETWYAFSYSGHSPSPYAVDWNLIGNDLGRSVRAGVAGTATIQPEMPAGYGKWVIVDAGGGWTYRYAHLSSISITSGQTVTPTTEIGKVGDTGNSDGSHLHYEQRFNNVVQPATFNSAAISYSPNLPGNPYTSANCPANPSITVELVHHWQSGSGATDAVRVTPGGLVWGGVSTIGPVAPGTGQFGLGHFNGDGVLDLYLVVTQGDPSGKSVVFVAAGPSYTNFLLQRSTPMGQFGSGHGDVVIADFTGDGKADVGVFFANNGAPKAAFGVLNAASEFQSWSYLAEVPIGGHDGARSDAVAGDFDANGSTDLGVGFHQGTPSGNVDFFTLSGSASYQSAAGATLPLGGWIDGQAQLLSGRLGGTTDRLAVIYTQSTPTGSPDLFVINGSSVSSWTLPVGYAPVGRRMFIGR
jgi:hypothetical protein